MVGLIYLLAWVLVVMLIFWFMNNYILSVLPAPARSVATVILVLIVIVALLYVVVGIMPPIPRLPRG